MGARAGDKRRLSVGRLAIVLGAGAALAGGLFALHRAQLGAQTATWKTRAEEAAAKKDWPEAVKLYEAYLNLKRDDEPALAAYAAAVEETTRDKPGGRAAAALAYERLLRVNPNRAAERKKLADWYAKEGQYNNARLHLDAWRELDAAGAEADPAYWETRAGCDAGERRFTEAAASLRKALATGKASPDSALGLGLILRDEVKTPESIEEAPKALDEMVARRPGDAEVLLARARYRAMGNNAEGAAADIAAARKAPGGDKNLTIVLASAEQSAAKGDWPAAEQALAAAVVLDPGNVRAALLRSAAAEARGDRAAAVNVVAEALDKVDKPTTATLSLADRLFELNAADRLAPLRAKLAADERLKLFGDYLAARSDLAAGNWPAAKPALEKLAAQPDVQRVAELYLPTLRALADAQGLAGDRPKQLETLEAALRRAPDDVSLLARRADAFAATGEAEKATEQLSALAARVPDGRTALARAALAEVLRQPAAARDWTRFDDAAGRPPYPPDLELTRAASFALRGRPEKTREILEALDATLPASDPRAAVSLAQMDALADPAKALQRLDAAKAKSGDRPEIRLARAGILFRQGKAAEVAALAEPPAGMPPAERADLRMGLAPLVAASDPAKAVEILRRAADDQPFRPAVRLALLDAALAAKNQEVWKAQRAELAKLEAADPVPGVAADVAFGLASTPPPSPAALAELRRQLDGAIAQRPGWGRLHRLAGDLEQLAGQREAATERYRRAAELGERSGGVAGKLVALLIDRRQYVEAWSVARQALADGQLPADAGLLWPLLEALAGGDPAKAAAWAKSAADSKEPRVQAARAAAFGLAGDREGVRAALEKAVELAPDDPSVGAALVQFFAASGDRAGAKKAADDMAKRWEKAGGSPEQVAARTQALASARLAAGDFAGAEPLLAAARKAQPESVAPLRDYLQLLSATGRGKEIEPALREAASAPAPAVRRWARRTLALLTAGPGPAALARAEELVAANLREDPGAVDDLRAKAVLLASDPFRRDEALKELESLSRRGVLSPSEGVLLARLLTVRGATVQASNLLRKLAQSPATATPEGLELLARVETERGDLASAQLAADQLARLAPESWEAAAARARVLARRGRGDEASAALLKWPGAKDPSARAGRVIPALEELELYGAAEKVARELAAGKEPASHVPLSTFLARRGRTSDALALAYERAGTAPAGVTARLLSGAVRSGPAALLTGAAQTARAADAAKARDWIEAKLKSAPGDADLLFARAEVAGASGDYDAELATYQDALGRFPQNPLFQNNLAVLLALHGNRDAARSKELVDRAIESQGPQPPLLDTRATVHLAAGRKADALRDVTAALAAGGPRPVYLFHQAQASEGPAADAAWAEAKRRGLAPTMLHPLEWADYRRRDGGK